MKPPKPRSIEALAAEEEAVVLKGRLAVLRRFSWFAVLALQVGGWGGFQQGRLFFGAFLVLAGLTGTAWLLGCGTAFRGRIASWGASVVLGLGVGFLYATRRSPGFQWGNDPSYWLAVLEGIVPQPFASPLTYLWARVAVPLLPGGAWPDLPLLACVGMAVAWSYLAFSSLEAVWEEGTETRCFAWLAAAAAALTLPSWLSAGYASGLTASLGLFLALMLQRVTGDKKGFRAGAFLVGGLFCVHPAWGILGLLIYFRRPAEGFRGVPRGFLFFLLGLTPALWIVFRAGHSLHDWGGAHPLREMLLSWNDLLAAHLAGARFWSRAAASLGWTPLPLAAGLLLWGWKSPGAAGSFLRLWAAFLGALFFYSTSGAVPGTTALWIPAGLAVWWCSVYREALRDSTAWNRFLRAVSWFCLLTAIGIAWIPFEREARFLNAAPVRHIENLLTNTEDLTGRRLLLLGENRFETEGAILLMPRAGKAKRDVIVDLGRLGDRWYLEQLIRRENEVLLSVGEGGRERVFPDLVRQNRHRWDVEWAVSIWPEKWDNAWDRLDFQAVPRVLTLRLAALGEAALAEDPSARYDLSDILEDARRRGGPAREALARYAVGLYAWGLSQTRAGKFTSAVRGFERAQLLGPDYDEPKRALERLYTEKSMVEAARLQFEQVVKLNPVRIQAAEKLLASGRLSAEDRLARLADKVRWAGSLSDALHHLGIIYEKQGRYDESRRALEEAVKWKPDRVTSQIELARLFLKMGNRSKAQAAYKAALEADPENKVAQAEMWKILNRP